jgi:hypothetical protein
MRWLAAETLICICQWIRDSAEWQKVDIDKGSLQTKVGKLRESLDIGKMQNALAEGGKPEDVLFDLGIANELYTKVLGPVEGTIKDKKQLLIVPSGALTSLPFHLLVTEKREKPATQASDYRDVAWAC